MFDKSFKAFIRLGENLSRSDICFEETIKRSQIDGVGSSAPGRLAEKGTEPMHQFFAAKGGNIVIPRDPTLAKDSVSTINQNLPGLNAKRNEINI